MSNLTGNQIRELFGIIDHNQNGTINIVELASFFVSFPFTGDFYSIDGIPLLSGAEADDVSGLMLYFYSFSNQYNSIEMNGFTRMVMETWPPTFQGRVRTFLELQFVPVLAPAHVQQIPLQVVPVPAPAHVPVQQSPFNKDTRIEGDVTLAGLSDNLKELTDREIIRKPHGHAILQQIRETEQLGACHEIHVKILRMVDLNRGIEGLVTIARRDYTLGIDTQELVQNFDRCLTKGIEIITLGRMGTIEQQGLTIEGLTRCKDYILNDRDVGMRQLIRDFNIARNPRYSFARLVFLVTAFLNSFNTFGDRVADIIIGSYTLGYFNMCVGGYDHDLQTYIGSNGRPLPNHILPMRCGTGLAECVLGCLENSIRTMIRRLTPAPAPAPVQRPAPAPVQRPAPRPVPNFGIFTSTAEIEAIKLNIAQHARVFGAAVDVPSRDAILAEANLAGYLAQFFPEWDPNIEHSPEIIAAKIGELNRVLVQYRLPTYRHKSLNGFKVSILDQVIRTHYLEEVQREIPDVNRELQLMACALYGPHFYDGESFVQSSDLNSPESYNDNPELGGGRRKFIKSKTRLSKKKYNKNKKSKKII